MVRAYCECCRRDVYAGAVEVTVVYRSNGTEGEFYLVCSACDGLVYGSLSSRTVLALAASGARLVDGDLPPTEDEIARFVSELEDGTLDRELAVLGR